MLGVWAEDRFSTGWPQKGTERRRVIRPEINGGRRLNAPVRWPFLIGAAVLALVAW